MEKKFDLKKFLSNNAIIILIILLALLVGCTTQNFFTETNGKNLLLNVAPRFIIACGVSGCLITKGTDLSAGRQVGLAACFSAMLLQSVDYSARMLPWLPDIPWPVALLIVMAIMACFGAINGCIIAFLKVPPFIATLGMQTIVYGLCSVITNNQPMGGYKQSYLTVASGTLGPIPFLAIFALIGGIFFGGVHDFGALFASIRHKGESIGEVIGDAIGARAKKLFIIFAYLTLILVVAAFASIVANTFKATYVDGVLDKAASAANASTAIISIMFILMAIILGFFVYRRNAPLGISTVIGVIGIAVCMYIGLKWHPIYLSGNVWMIIVGLYIAIASVTPVWILLQPRDYLSSFLLYAMMICLPSPASRTRWLPPAPPWAICSPLCS